MSRSAFRSVVAVICAMLAALAAEPEAFGQAGSTGGTVGKTDKSISGGVEETSPASADQPLVRTLTVGDQAISVAFSPDGNLIAANEASGTLFVWSTADGRLQAPAISGVSAHTTPFSPDGKWIAAGSNRDVKIWDAVTKRVLRTFSGHEGPVRAVAFAHDGKLLVSGAADHMVFIWDLAGNQPGRRLAGHSDLVYSVALLPGWKAHCLRKLRSKSHYLGCRERSDCEDTAWHEQDDGRHFLVRRCLARDNRRLGRQCDDLGYE